MISDTKHEKLRFSIEYVVGMGDVKASNDAAKYVCHGLGSCIALFLYDDRASVSAAAHIMLPGMFTDEILTPTSYASNAIANAWHLMTELGSDGRNVKAKLAGGASLFKADTFQIGKLNYEGISKELGRYNIPIIAKDIGGSISRTARFCSSSKTLVITYACSSQFQIKL